MALTREVNSSAERMMKEIENMIVQNTTDLPRLVGAIVQRVNDDGSVDVILPPDSATIFTKIKNQSAFSLAVGDSVELMLKNGSFSNCWVVAKHGVSFDPTFTRKVTDTVGNYAALITSKGVYEDAIANNVRYNLDQSGTKTDAEKLVARTNIGAAPLFSNAGSHNGVFRGNDITTLFDSGAFSSQVSAGTFDDIFIGDYITKTITDPLSSSGATVTMHFVVAGLNLHKYRGADVITTQNHVVIVPRECFPTSAYMHSSSSTPTACFVATDMYTITLPAYASAISTILGSGHILRYSDEFAGSYSTSVSSKVGANKSGGARGYNWDHNVGLSLLTEQMLTGTSNMLSSFRERDTFGAQFPLFALNPESIVSYIGDTRTDYWLRNTTNENKFLVFQAAGDYAESALTNTKGVRPFFLMI